MRFLNEHEVEDAARQRAGHPTLGPATATLANLVRWANDNSDGWAYWPKPCRAAARLQALIDGDGSWEGRYGDRPEVTAADVRKTYGPIKALLTRHNAAWSEVIVPADGRPFFEVVG